jgi:3-deoxy-7-phosphoheptulonate synthase/chorismate mutase
MQEDGGRRLAELRSRVDRINLELLALLQRRGEVVLSIAEVKRELGREGFDPRREEEMLRSLVRRSEGPFGPGELRGIFRAIFRASLELQDRCLRPLPRPNAVGE